MPRTIRRSRELRERLTLPEAPRQAAIRFLAVKLAAGQAGLDPYDASVVLVDVAENEQVWARAAVECVGLFLHQGGSQRIRMLLEADVRQELGLDAPDAPVMADEPLASRGLTVLHLVGEDR